MAPPGACPRSREAHEAFKGPLRQHQPMSRPLVAATTTLLLLLALPGAHAVVDAGSVKIAEGSFHAITLALNESTQVLVTVSRVSGPHIDLFLLDSPNFELYRQGKQFVYASEGSRLDITKANLTVTVSDGLWYVVLDNTDAGKAHPGLLDAFDKEPVVRFEVIHPFTVPDQPDQVPLLSGPQAIMLSVVLVTILVVLLVWAARAAAHHQKVADTPATDPTQRVDLRTLPPESREPR